MIQLWMVFPKGLSKALTLSYDDGVEQDARLIAIMNRNGLKGTFNLNGGQFSPEGTVFPNGHIHRRMTRQAAYDLYAGSGHEVAVHALWHGDLPDLPPAHAIWQVMRDREELENMFGCIVRGMAYPYGTVTPELAETLKGCGIAYSRTVESTRRFDLPHNWLQMPATCHHDDPRLMELAQKFVSGKPYRPQLFYLWGHSYEFEANNNWQVIEDFAAFVGGREDIWYATNIEIHDYVEAWRSMHISADGKRLYNPSALTLWANANGSIIEIPSGYDVRID